MRESGKNMEEGVDVSIRYVAISMQQQHKEKKNHKETMRNATAIVDDTIMR